MANKDRFLEEESMGYNINIVGRNTYVTEAMKQYAWDKLSKIERFHSHIMDVHMTLDIQKLEHSVTIIVKFDHFKIKSHAVTTDMYVSIDQAIDRLQKQFRRWKGRFEDHNQKKLSVVDMKVNVLQRPYNELEDFNAEIETEVREKRSKETTPGKVIGQETRPLKQLTTDEAMIKMELSGDHFLIYRSEEDRKIKVIYRRSDGNYGIIQPE